jgi:hypothetical protein
MTLSSPSSSSSAGNTSSASQGTPSSPAGQHGAHQATGGVPSGGAGFDIDSIISPLREEIGSLKKGYHTAHSEAREANERMAKVAKLLAGEDGDSGEGEGEGEGDGWYDSVLSELIAAKAKGIEMPLTGRLAAELQRTQSETKELKAQLRKAMGALQQVSDPQRAQDHAAYAQMDSMLMQEAQSVWGADVSEHQVRALSTQITEFLRQVQREAPEKWHQIRHNPRSQQKIIRHFVSESIPKQHRNLMQEVREAQQPLTRQDIMEAIQEAQQIKNPDQRAKVIEVARRRLLELSFDQRRGQR